MKLTVNGAEPVNRVLLPDKLDETEKLATTVGALINKDCVTDAVIPVATLVAFKVTAKLLPVVVYVCDGLISELVVPSPKFHKKVATPRAKRSGLDVLEN